MASRPCLRRAMGAGDRERDMSLVGKTVLLNSFRPMAAVSRRPTSSGAATSD